MAFLSFMILQGFHAKKKDNNTSFWTSQEAFKKHSCCATFTTLILFLFARRSKASSRRVFTLSVSDFTKQCVLGPFLLDQITCYLFNTMGLREKLVSSMMDWRAEKRRANGTRTPPSLVQDVNVNFLDDEDAHGRRGTWELWIAFTDYQYMSRCCCCLPLYTLSVTGEVTCTGSLRKWSMFQFYNVPGRKF